MKRRLISLGLVLGLCSFAAIASAKPPQDPAYQDLVAAANAEESNQYLIELAGGGPADLAAVITAAGGTLVHDLADIGSASAISDEPTFASQLSKTAGIRRVTRDLLVQWIPDGSDMETASGVQASGHLTDPNLAVFRPCQWGLDQIDVAGAWAQGEFGAGTTVAVLDTGVSGDPAFGGGGAHDDMLGKLVGNVTVVSQDVPACAAVGASDSVSPLDFRFHGTYVAGLIAAHGFGIAGVAPDANLYGVKVLNCNASGTFSDVIAGILHAANEPIIDVINMSVGAYFRKTIPAAHGLVAALNKAVNYAQGVKGKLVVSAAGNNFADLDHNGNLMSLPAEAGSGVSAWAGDIDGNLAFYSNHGVSGTLVGAAGGDVTPDSPNLPIAGCNLRRTRQDGIVSVCSPDSLFFSCGGDSFYLAGGSGTSFSSPIVAGVGALAAGANPGLNGNQLKALLKNTADDLGKKGTDNLFSHGRVNAHEAVQ